MLKGSNQSLESGQTMLVISLDKGHMKLAALSPGYDEPTLAKLIINDIASVRFTPVPASTSDFVSKHGHPTTEWLSVLSDSEVDAHIFA